MLPKLFVVSFGYKQVVKHMLESCGVQPLITEIITPAAIGQHEGVALSNKNKLIQYGLDRHNLTRGMLLDHWKPHVDAVAAAGHWGYYVNFHRGLTVKDTNRIFHIVKKHSIDALFLSSDITIFQEYVTSQYIYKLFQTDSEVKLTPKQIIGY